MSAKILSTALVAGVLLAITVPAFAVDAPPAAAPTTPTPPAAKTDTTAAPKTKAECKKLTDMKWDKTSKTCVKK